MCSSSDEEEALLLLALAEDEDNNRKRKWVHEINLDRIMYGEFHTLMQQLRKDEKRFYKYFGMTSDCFDEILSFIEDDISKENTNYRESICSEERLAIALRYLATGDSYSTIGHSYRVGFLTVSYVVKEVCAAICKRMQQQYLPDPTKPIWGKSAEGFKNVWQFPNCIGAIDGKHVTIKCPKKSGSNNFCYLHKFSIVLMAIVGPEYEFICVDIGGYGKNSDGGIFEVSNMGRRFENGLMDVPHEKTLPGQNQPCPHVLIGDEAFSLKPHLMRPFPYRQSRANTRQENFNKNLCRARRVVENAFGILAQKWRLYFRPIELSEKTTISVVKTTCILHNFLRTKPGDSLYLQYLEDPKPTMAALVNFENDPRRAANEAFNVREMFVAFFNNN